MVESTPVSETLKHQDGWRKSFISGQWYNLNEESTNMKQTTTDTLGQIRADSEFCSEHLHNTLAESKACKRAVTDPRTVAGVKFDKSFLGIVLDGAYDSADSINRETVSFAEQYGFTFDRPAPENEDDEDFGQIWSELGDDAVSFLNDQDLLPYCSFYFEDNSLFYTPSIEMASEDVEFKSSRENEYPEDDFTGEWLHVNDHGNATLYVRNDKGEDKELWSLV